MAAKKRERSAKETEASIIMIPPRAGYTPEKFTGFEARNDIMAYIVRKIGNIGYNVDSQ